MPHPTTKLFLFQGNTILYMAEKKFVRHPAFGINPARTQRGFIHAPMGCASSVFAQWRTPRGIKRRTVSVPICTSTRRGSTTAIKQAGRGKTIEVLGTPVIAAKTAWQKPCGFSEKVYPDGSWQKRRPMQRRLYAKQLWNQAGGRFGRANVVPRPSKSPASPPALRPVQPQKRAVHGNYSTGGRLSTLCIVSSAQQPTAHND